MTSFGLTYTIGLVIVLAVAFAATLPELLRAPKREHSRRLRLRWEPRDMWIGIYREPASHRTFLCVLPCVVLVVEPRPKDSDGS